jgi:hypothetical protein
MTLRHIDTNTKYTETKRKGIQHNDTKHNANKHHYTKQNDTEHKTTLNIITKFRPNIYCVQPANFLLICLGAL